MLYFSERCFHLVDELGTKKAALAKSLSTNALLPWASSFHVSLKTGYLEGKDTAAKALQAQGFGTCTMLLLPYYIGQSKAQGPPHVQTGRGTDSVSCWKMWYVTCRGACMQRGVIHWRSFHNLSQTHKGFCVKKKKIH